MSEIDYPVLMKTILRSDILVLAALNLFDLATTLRCLAGGLVEGNPFLSHGGDIPFTLLSLIFFKGLLFLYVLIVIHVFGKDNPSFLQTGIIVVNFLFLVIVLNNSYLLFSLTYQVI